MGSTLKFLFFFNSLMVGIATGVAVAKVEKIPLEDLELPRNQVAVIAGAASFLVALGIQFLLLACSYSGTQRKRVTSSGSKKSSKVAAEHATKEKTPSAKKKKSASKPKAKASSEAVRTPASPKMSREQIEREDEDSMDYLINLRNKRTEKKDKLAAEKLEQQKALMQKPVRKVSEEKPKEEPAKSPEKKHIKPSVEVIEVDIAKHSLLIGKAGATLKQIQEATGAKVHVPKKEENSKFITIRGTKQQIADAKVQVLELARKGYSQLINPGTTEARVHVGSKAMGIVIGTGGQTIKLIQEKTQTKINIPEKGGEDVVVIGPAEGVAAAKEALVQLAQDGFCTMLNEGFVKVEMTLTEAQLGVLVGPKGQTIKRIQTETGASVKTPERGSRGATKIIGLAENVELAKQQIDELFKDKPMEVEPEKNGPWADQQLAEPSFDDDE